MLEEPADTFDGVEGGGSWARTSGLTVGKGDGALVESHEATSGEGDPEDIRSEVCEGCGAIGPRLGVDVPGDMPDVWVDLH